MILIPSGITSSLTPQSLIISFDISLSPVGRETEESALQPANALSPMLTTFSGITSSASRVQFSKAPFSITVISSDKVTLTIPLPLKAYSPIILIGFPLCFVGIFTSASAPLYEIRV